MVAALDADWLDTMVSKLIAELEKQLNAVGKAKEKGATAQTRAADARTLAALENTLERLSRLERERAAIREKRLTHDASPRAALERRLDKRLAAVRKKGAAGKP
jgi:site-specific recombinase